MSALPETGIARRVALIEEALADALHGGDFEVVTDQDERYLVPVLDYRHASIPDAVVSRPMLSLYRAAREIERLLS